MRYRLQHEGWWETRPEMARRVEGQVRAVLRAARARRLVPVNRGADVLAMSRGAVGKLVKEGILYFETRRVGDGRQTFAAAFVDPREVEAWVRLPFGIRRDVRRGWCTLEVMSEMVLAPRDDEEESRPVSMAQGEMPSGRLPAWAHDEVERWVL